jgi:hypothetical protein
VVHFERHVGTAAVETAAPVGGEHSRPDADVRAAAVATVTGDCQGRVQGDRVAYMDSAAVRAGGIAAATVLLVGALVLAKPTPSHAAQRCGSIIVPSYEVRIKKGDISCSNARRIMKHYLDNFPSDPRGWRCKREPAFENPILLPGRLATCGRKSDNDKVILVGTQAPGPEE